jgi:hypothetical protein
MGYVFALYLPLPLIHTWENFVAWEGEGKMDGYNRTEIKEKSQNETTEKKREKNNKNRKRKKKDVPEMEVEGIKTEGN